MEARRLALLYSLCSTPLSFRLRSPHQPNPSTRLCFLSNYSRPFPGFQGDCLWTSESLHRRPLKMDSETSGLANHVRELLLNVSEERKDQVSSTLS
ncbi:hypothetical protein V6N13_020271 [Hibiscus sabdariffa]|uniref:Uncharacterized protein n=1 Tax=Hibiscus sabdariffa TaxID=183260 RepID=A0ABR2ETE9_9ROSI